MRHGARPEARVMVGRTYTRRHRARDVRRAHERAYERTSAVQGDAQDTNSTGG